MPWSLASRLNGRMSESIASRNARNVPSVMRSASTARMPYQKITAPAEAPMSSVRGESEFMRFWILRVSR